MTDSRIGNRIAMASPRQKVRMVPEYNLVVMGARDVGKTSIQQMVSVSTPKDAGSYTVRDKKKAKAI